MKKLFLIAVLSFGVSGFAFAKGGGHGGSKGKVVHVKQHTTKKGKVVKAHDRTAPNKSKQDNWSTKGNTNPETGKAGTKSPSVTSAVR
jgi:hypothetical protein